MAAPDGAGSLNAGLDALDAAAAAQLYARVDRAEVEGARDSWAFRARPEQLVPEGDWRLWLIMAGRGYDPQRDFGATVQRVLVPGGAGQTETITLPVAMAAEEAKSLAMRHAARLASQRETDRSAHGFAALALMPGQTMAAGATRRSRIVERQIEGAMVRLAMQQWVDPAPVGTGADGGRGVLAQDMVHGPSVAVLIDMPLRSEPVAEPVRLLAVAGTGAGWRSADVAVRAGAEFDPVPVAAARRALVVGTVVSTSGNGNCPLFDDSSAIVVELSDPAMTLAEAGDAALLAGANLAAAGAELIQFGRVEPAGPRRWRLTRLLRGRLGSEGERAAAGDGFALIDDPALVALPSRVGLVPLGAGGTVEIAGMGDAAPLVIPTGANARSITPLSPTALAARWTTAGGLHISWTRRTLAGLGWDDLVDVPPPPSGERNQVTMAAGPSRLTVDAATDSIDVDADQIAAWRMTASSLDIAVRRAGIHGLSPPATLAIAL